MPSHRSGCVRQIRQEILSLALVLALPILKHPERNWTRIDRSSDLIKLSNCGSTTGSQRHEGCTMRSLPCDHAVVAGLASHRRHMCRRNGCCNAVWFVFF